MAVAIFLSEATLKAESVIQDNVDVKIIAPTIRDVQNIYILPILGTALYNQLSAAVTAGTPSADQIVLLDNYIIPCMIWYVKFELPLNLNYKILNKSVGTQNADNMNPASMDDLQMVMANARNKAEWYAERLTKYLRANGATFPLFLNQTDVDVATIFPKRDNFTSGMVLGGAGCCRGEYNFQGIKTGASSFDRDRDCC